MVKEKLGGKNKAFANLYSQFIFTNFSNVFSQPIQYD